MLADRAEQLEADLAKRERQGWTTYQVADQLLHEKLAGMKAELQPYRDPSKRAAALATFHEYAYQWY